MKPQRVVVLLNSAAGTIVRRGEHEFRDKLEALFAQHDIAADLKIVAGKDLPAAARDAIRDARSGACDTIVVGGGDGSISTVAGQLIGTGIPFGILPLGTLNHFAGDLGISADLDAAVEIVAQGEVQDIDTAAVNGRTFVNNSSIGLYPYMVLERERTRRRSAVPKWLAMIWASWRVLRFFPLRRLSIPAAGREPYRSPCVFIGNNEYDLIGPLRGRRQRLHDGMLSLYIADQRSRWALTQFAMRLLLGRVEPDRDLKMLALPEIEIHSRHRRRLLVSLDGEIEAMRTPLRYVTQPASLRVYAPPRPGTLEGAAALSPA